MFVILHLCLKFLCFLIVILRKLLSIGVENEVVEENEDLEDEDEVEEFNPMQSDLMSHLQRVLSKTYCTGICQQKISLKVCLTYCLFDLMLKKLCIHTFG